MLDADVQPLLNDAVAHSLVHLHADCSWCDVPHEAGLAVIELVRHALLDCTVAGYVNQLADLECLQVGAGANITTLALKNSSE